MMLVSAEIACGGNFCERFGFGCRWLLLLKPIFEFYFADRYRVHRPALGLAARSTNDSFSHYFL